jgi:hypothetical protein
MASIHTSCSEDPTLQSSEEEKTYKDEKKD